MIKNICFFSTMVSFLVLFSCSESPIKHTSNSDEPTIFSKPINSTLALQEIKTSLKSSERNRFDLYLKSKSLLTHTGFSAQSFPGEKSDSSWQAIYTPKKELQIQLPSRKEPYSVPHSQLKIYPGIYPASVCFSFGLKEQKTSITLTVLIENCFDNSLSVSLKDQTNGNLNGCGNLLIAKNQDTQSESEQQLSGKYFLFKVGAP